MPRLAEQGRIVSIPSGRPKCTLLRSTNTRIRQTVWESLCALPATGIVDSRPAEHTAQAEGKKLSLEYPPEGNNVSLERLAIAL